MKFRQIKMLNFMRYKGENTLEFSCDPKNNVTVVMGDNTFGKTCLAQAFRWGLYGEIIDTRYGKSKDAILLNKDVLADMGDSDINTVSVELEVENDDVIYRFKREAIYYRRYPELATRQKSEKLYMRIKPKGEMWGDWIENDSDRKHPDIVMDNIQNMFPKELSSYFFFDGERWSDEQKTNKQIKDSISTLMGITPLVRMRNHIKDGNRKSVLKILEGRITGSGTRYVDLKRNVERNEKLIEEWENERSTAIENAKRFREKIDKTQNMLDSNEKIERYQTESNNLISSINNAEKHMETEYSNIVKMFSKDAYKYLATPLLEEVIDMLKDVNLEGKDIPDITDKTIDYLKNQTNCICGNCIGEKEIKCLEELKKVIPPNVIGSYVGQYQSRLEEWKFETEDFVDRMKEVADRYEAEKMQYEENIERKEQIDKIIDGKINFAIERAKMKSNINYEREELEKIRRCEKNIEETKEIIKEDRNEMQHEAAHTAENIRIQRMITYAKALYEEAEKNLRKKEEPLMDELNEIIRINFEEMFNEKEKFAQIEDDYRLHLYYKDMGNNVPVEEKNLSEGEIIARNFVFIVSILELAQKKKREDEEGIINLPLVLDGPFSKLSEINTKLIAEVLPEAAEQVIIFMWKDKWEASGLEKYTLPEYRYHVEKEIDENSSQLKGDKV